MTDIETYVNNTIGSNEVVIFSKSYCPYCNQTKDLFTSKYPNVQTKIIEMNGKTEISDGSSMQQYLATRTGQRTVPNVFVKGKHIGGNDDTQRAHASGSLF
eukprot:CAMPEP_0171305350 /NCGR_PEP_ID=MMETSP0816-20121228/15177_1 /TAXON_ID=420281 /ORGANISM="Proboscia inermis, Strain CCAP1064/1" /LENGTH=100 /DNA_ID=CAMNT_0011786111 /DNA_START=45 /DNA_END=347 /DNA_ORIENTATION=-